MPEIVMGETANFNHADASAARNSNLCSGGRKSFMHLPAKQDYEGELPSRYSKFINKIKQLTIHF